VGDLVSMLLVVAIGLAMLGLLVFVTVRGPLRRFARATARLRGDVTAQVATLQALTNIRRPRA
jgi:hypothetical protein